MKRILGFACALTALFIVAYTIKNPDWFNGPRHFLGGFLAACLLGACLERFAPKVFDLYAPWLPGVLMLLTAVFFWECDRVF